MPRLSMMLLLPLLAAACTTMSPAPAPAPAAPMAMTMAGGFPLVAHTVTIADGDIPASAPADMRSALVGPWVVGFGNNGHAMVTVNGRQVVDAPYTISGNTLTLTAEDSGEYACHSTGTYTWHATATELHLTRVNDSCDGRVVVLTTHALVRQ